MVPTLRELETICQKPNWRKVGSLLARRVARPAAIYLTWLVVRWPVSANAITALTLVVGGAAAFLLGLGKPQCFVAGTIVLNLWYLLDHVDGQVARYRRGESVTGIYFDFMMHHLVHPACAFALGYGIASQRGELIWSLAGAGFAFGVMLLAINNDCRYKAFFKVIGKGGSSGMQGVAGEEGEETSRRHGDTECEGITAKCLDVGSRRLGLLGNTEDSIPSTQFGVLSNRRTLQSQPRLLAWKAAPLILQATSRAILRLLQKACEMPSIVIALSLLAVPVGIGSPTGLCALQGYVLVLSVLAPVLGLARLAKQIWSHSPDKEFLNLMNAISKHQPSSKNQLNAHF